MKWLATAPSNIALIKYMGKQDPKANIPTNSSLSYTLDHLITEVKLTTSSSENDCWQPFHDDHLNLSSKAQKRFLAHLNNIKQKLNFNGSFVVQSKNNFPLGCGLASSAASFAALTKCAVKAICELTNKDYPTLIEQSATSRQNLGDL